MQVNIQTLLKMKQNKMPISALTCYDASFAFWFNQAEIHILLVGDTLGEIIQGHKSTIPVTVADIVYHTANVYRNLSYSFLIADMPFLQHATIDKAITTAHKLMQAGACMVKLEGGAWLANTIQKLTELGIPVCAHLGYTPQSLHSFGGAKIIGKTQSQAENLIKDAKTLATAGAQLLIVECIPDALGKTLSEQLPIPVIGIGAGPYCDGQILVSYDMLGITPNCPPIAKCFLTQENPSILAATKAYKQAVTAQEFPTKRPK